MPNNTTKSSTRGFGAWLSIAFFLIVIDQITKNIVEYTLQYGQRINVLPVFDFILVYNQGASFSFLANEGGWQRWVFITIAAAASAFILYLLKKGVQNALFGWALVLILAGALGNVIDRIIYGHVIDFLLAYWDVYYFPAFNVADICITFGAIFLVLDEILRIKKGAKA